MTVLAYPNLEAASGTALQDRSSPDARASLDARRLRQFACIVGLIATLALVFTVAGCAPATTAPSARLTAPATEAPGTLTILLTDFAFSPDHITLRTGEPIRLRLVNQSSGGHDFSAPTFFAASSFPAGSMAPAGGAIEVGSKQTVEITLTPRKAGTYSVECTHFLHSLFGMTATIKVES